MVDLHNHILFEMDDGAQNLEESMRMIHQGMNQGITKFVVTPHFNPITDDLEVFVEKRNQNVKVLREAVNQQGWDVSIKTGAEVYFSSDLLNMDLEDLRYEDSSYILIELPTTTMPSSLVSQISSIAMMGYQPILAHVERYGYFRDNSDLMVNLIKNGVLMQINGNSFSSKNHKKFIKDCIKHNLIHLVSSDAHNLDTRPMNTGEALRIIEHDYSKDFSHQLIENANRVFEDEDVEVLMPSPIRKVFGLF